MLNFLKKSKEPKAVKQEPDNFLMYYVENGELKIKFSFDKIDNFINLADSVLNGKVRNSSLNTIKSKLIENGFGSESILLSYLIESYIKPSEYKSWKK